ncbi:MAG: SAM-dependent methyltransferase [Chloroflexota bacterium]
MANLIIVGSGIKMAAHLTQEAVGWIKSAGKVFYVANNALVAVHIQLMNDTAEDLSSHYAEGKHRQKTYDGMVEQVVNCLHDVEHVCVVFYGHPSVFVTPAPKMIQLARERGHQAEILPGISAEDCLFSDLAIDPAEYGCQSYEATDFLWRPRVWDVHSGLVLWQVGVIGHFTAPNEPIKEVGIRLLVERLLELYPAEHEVIIYEAAVSILSQPRIEKLPLAELASARLTQISTLYIPPVKMAPLDPQIYQKFIDEGKE